MRKNLTKIVTPVMMAVFFLCLSPSLQAESEFSGNFLFGYRLVDTSGPGADYKYKEDFNLQSGPRLNAFTLSYAPDNGLKKFFDRLEMQVYNFGGDPFETFDVTLRKYGKYMVRYERKKSTYFYHDLNQVEGSGLYDLHTFDFDRVIDSGTAKFSVNRALDLFFNFDRYSKKGQSSTTQEISREVFELEKPIQEDSIEFAIGADYHAPRYSLLFEWKYQDYDNENSLFLPSYARDEEALYPTSLDYYVLTQPYTFSANTPLFKFHVKPIDALIVSGSFMFMTLDMSLDYTEEAQGINYLGRIIDESSGGSGNFKRKIYLYDFDGTYILSSKLALLGGIRYHFFDQNGAMTIEGETESMLISYNTLGFDAGLQYHFSPTLALTLGYRYENRGLAGTETATYEYDTQKGGFFGDLKWTIIRGLKMTLDYEHSNYENPYTLISPTDFDRIRFTLKYNFDKLYLSGSLLLTDIKSEVFEDVYDSSKNQFSLRAGYNDAKLKLFAGYSYIDVEHRADRTVVYPPYWTTPGGSFLWEIFYEGKSSLFDAGINYDLDQNWKLGGYFNVYSNSGSWEIDRTMFKAYVEYRFTRGYVAQVGYRYVDFGEKASGANDYSASIFEFSFGYRWQ